MSNMVVNTNVMALNSHRSLKGVGNMQSKASSRLSSGLKINSAADDAAGLAISEKMRAQIRGLDMASKNSQDAISLIQTAEGGMQEIDNMLQRIRELVVQSSNDTNEQDMGTDKAVGDRQKIQDEINQLVAEIDSMADRVEFNKKKVIDGSFRDATQTTLPNISSLVTVGDTTPAAGTPAVPGTSTPEQQVIFDMAELRKTDEFARLSASTNTAVKDFMTQVELVADKSVTAIQYSDFIAGIIDITATGANGYALAAITSDPTATADITAVAAALEAMADKLDPAKVMPSATTKADGTTPAVGVATGYGESIQAVSALVESGIGVGGTPTTSNTQAALLDFYKNNTQANWDAVIAAAKIDDASGTTTPGTILDKLTSNAGKDLITQVLADRDALAAEIAGGPATGADTPAVPGGASTLYFQVGANANQKLEVNINSVKSDALGIGDGSGSSYIDVIKYSGSEITEILNGLDSALSYVTTERSKLGAVQNRLEYTIKSLDISSENLSASESRIRDTDMAKEMMNFTKANVLQQAATSMLAQANQAPQMILKLLG